MGLALTSERQQRYRQVLVDTKDASPALRLHPLIGATLGAIVVGAGSRAT